MLKDCNNKLSLTDHKQCRCSCGQLMAIQTDRGIEIKCKRCKQVHVIPLTMSERISKEGENGTDI